MPESDPKTDLHYYLQVARGNLLWKLEGLSEYDIRRPLTPTGTNLLGLVKHLIGCELGYFGDTFGRPFEPMPPWLTSDEPNVDFWATADESRSEIIELYRQVCAHSDATIEASTVDTAGCVEHWLPEHRDVTLHRILVHMLAETNRHAGHADIVRELIDGTAGFMMGNENLPGVDETWWSDYLDRLERVAEEVRDAQTR
ncbi:DinB family protein [Antrihabitans spumae]|uniref:DinB family protein n=1 Tax=Antrihabitans spumae TaxID=3373370 RepID=A0ABW7KW13_9NOCA